MQRIDDQRFSRWFCRFVGFRSRAFDGAPIVVVTSPSGGADLEIHITNGICAVISIGWRNGQAWLLPGSSMLRPDDLFGLEDTLTIHVSRLLRRHGLIDSRGRVARKGAA